MKSIVGLLTLGLAALLYINGAWADGTEVLGPPGIAIESGTGVSIAGTGMVNQPGKITVKVPGGASIKQVPAEAPQMQQQQQPQPQQSQPTGGAAPQQAPAPMPAQGFDNFDDDIPF